jgi:ribosomal protein L37E
MEEKKDNVCDKCQHKSWMEKLWICPNCGYDNIRKMEEQ